MSHKRNIYNYIHTNIDVDTSTTHTVSAIEALSVRVAKTTGQVAVTYQNSSKQPQFRLSAKVLSKALFHAKEFILK